MIGLSPSYADTKFNDYVLNAYYYVDYEYNGITQDEEGSNWCNIIIKPKFDKIYDYCYKNRSGTHYGGAISGENDFFTIALILVNKITDSDLNYYGNYYEQGYFEGTQKNYLTFISQQNNNYSRLTSFDGPSMYFQNRESNANYSSAKGGWYTYPYSSETSDVYGDTNTLNRCLSSTVSYFCCRLSLDLEKYTNIPLGTMSWHLEDGCARTVSTIKEGDNFKENDTYLIKLKLPFRINKNYYKSFNILPFVGFVNEITLYDVFDISSHYGVLPFSWIGYYYEEDYNFENDERYKSKLLLENFIESNYPTDLTIELSYEYNSSTRQTITSNLPIYYCELVEDGIVIFDSRTLNIDEDNILTVNNYNISKSTFSYNFYQFLDNYKDIDGSYIFPCQRLEANFDICGKLEDYEKKTIIGIRVHYTLGDFEDKVVEIPIYERYITTKTNKKEKIGIVTNLLGFTTNYI